MAAPLHRAMELLLIKRFKEAQQAAQEALAADPDSVGAHMIIAQAAIQMDRPQQALESVNTAIGISPNEAECFLTRARIYLSLKKYKLARVDCQKALELNPHDPSIFGVLAWSYAAESKWSEALKAAEEGLQHDPEETNCINARARALMYLKQGDRAFEAIKRALARDPNDSYTHTNAGWAKLQAGQREEALNHFTEALQRDPNNGHAREGLIASMKAKNPIYGALLSYSFFMTGLKPGMRIAVLVGGYVVYQLTWRSFVASGHMLIAGIIMCVWMGLVLLTWAGDAIFNLLLLLNPRGRLILSPKQKGISYAVGSACLLGFGTMITHFTMTAANPLLFIGVGFLLTCLPLAYAGNLEGKKLAICLGISGVCTLLLLGSAGLFFAGFEPDKIFQLRDIALYTLVAFSWIGPSVLKRDH